MARLRIREADREFALNAILNDASSKAFLDGVDLKTNIPELIDIVCGDYIAHIESELGCALEGREKRVAEAVFLRALVFVAAAFYSANMKRTLWIFPDVLNEMCHRCGSQDLMEEREHFLESLGEAADAWIGTFRNEVLRSSIWPHGRGLIYAFAMAFIAAEEAENPHVAFAYRVYTDPEEQKNFLEKLSEEAPAFYRAVYEMCQEYVTSVDPPLLPQEKGNAEEQFIRLASLVFAWLHGWYGNRNPQVTPELIEEVHRGCKVEATVLEYYDILSSVDPELMTYFDTEASRGNMHPHGRVHIYALGVAFKIAAEELRAREAIAEDVAKGADVLRRSGFGEMV